MTDLAKTRALVERLRKQAQDYYQHPEEADEWLAADTIEAQAARIEQLEEMCRALAGKDK